MRRSQDVLNIGVTEARLAKLAARLDKFDRGEVLALIGGLTTDPDWQTNAVRIEMLAHLAALRCRGRLHPQSSHLKNWLNDILSDDAVGMQEDPPEDVFVGNVVSGHGNARVFEGIWEANAAYLQSCLFAISRLAHQGKSWAQHCLRQAGSLLALSDAIAERAGLARYAEGSGRRRARIAFSSARLAELSDRVRFSPGELDDLGIHPFDLSPFAFGDGAVLRDETLCWTSLERRPLLLGEAGVIVALPSGIGAAIRRRAIEMALDHGDGDAFEALLNQHQFGMSVGHARTGLGLEALSPPTAQPDEGIIELHCQFDEGAYAHLIFVQDRIAEIAQGGFQSIRDASTLVARASTKAAAELSARPDYRIGLTIVIFGGLGRGMKVEHAPMPDQWRFIGIGYEDFELLGWDHEVSALRLHRIQQQVHEMRRNGIDLFNMNGFMNLYGYAVEQDFQLVHDMIRFGRAHVQIASDYLRPLRIRLRHALDRHVAPMPGGGHLVDVQRLSTQAFFEEVTQSPLYASIADLGRGRAAACVETKQRHWWVALDDLDGGVRGLPYRVWDMARNWLVPVARAIDAALPTLDTRLIAITIHVGIAADGDDLDIDPDLPIRPPDVTVEGTSIRIACDADYMRAFARPENIGDRWLVEAIARGAAMIAEEEPEPFASRIGAAVVADDQARYLHIYTARSAPQAVLGSAPLPRPRMIAPEVRHWLEAGLAYRVDPAIEPGTRLGGRQATDFLAAAVDQLWHSARDRLELIDREKLIALCLAHHDAIERDRTTWRHTAAAVLQLHDRARVLQAAVERESERAEAGLCLRVTAEMALCTAPLEGGRTPGDDDLDYLLACVALLNGIAARSDEIHAGLADQVEIQPNGMLRFRDDFALEVHSPFLTRQSQDQFIAAADAYDELYERSEPLEEEDYAARADPAFDAAFAAEYGVIPLVMADVVTRIGERALEAGTALLRLSRSELVAIAATQAGDADQPEAFVDAWTLRPRARWDEPSPADARASDWYPWCHARRLSVLARPFIALDIGENPPCLVAPVMAEHALYYALRAHRGYLPASFFRSEAMQRWMGGMIDRLGHRFNRRVRDRLRELGWKAEADVQMTRLGGRAVDGDVDVLAWDEVTGRVHIIECKRLLTDRTPGEVAARLREYAPDHPGRGARRGPARKHLDRMAKLKAQSGPLSAVTGMAPDRMRLSSCLVTSALVPMQFHAAAKGAFDLIAAITDLEPPFSPDATEAP